jgi:hypothetical protein
MSRRSLRPQLNQIRTWVRQGRTDAWIAHTLQVTVQQLQSFKREQGLDGSPEEAPSAEEIDLRAEDDAAIAAQLEEEERQRAEEEERRRVEEEQRQAEEAARAAEEAERRAAERAERAERGEAEGEDDGDETGDEDEDGDRPRRRRRGGRGRRRVGAGKSSFEGTFDHGEEGYGLWLDPDVADNPVYAEHWAGHRPVEVTIEEDQIVIRRAGAGDDAA